MADSTDAAGNVFVSERHLLPAVMAHNERIVRAGFWKKIVRTLAVVPFADRAVAAWYCARDPATPLRVKGILLAALAYFVLPLDLVPDFVAGLGFTDDLTVIVTAVGLVRQHITASHKAAARATIERLRAGGPAPE